MKVAVSPAFAGRLEVLTGAGVLVVAAGDGVGETVAEADGELGGEANDDADSEGKATLGWAVWPQPATSAEPQMSKVISFRTNANDRGR